MNRFRILAAQGPTGLALLLTAAATALVPAQATQAAVRTFTSATINSATSVNFDPAADAARDTSGAPVQLSVSGAHDLAYSNGPGYTLKNTTDDVFSRASVEDGDLKTKAVLGFGTDISGIVVPLNTRNASSAATAEMGDSFTTYSGNAPFAWTGGTKVRFAFDITGTSEVPGGLPSAATSKNQVYSQLVVRILEPGGVDVYHQLQTFDFEAYPDFDTAYAAYNALNAQYTASLIDSDYWILEDSIVPWSIDPEHTFHLDSEVPAHLEFEFAPGGNFEWLMQMDTTVHLDASQQDITVALDLSHTIVTSYVGPEGATTYSASGLYPGTEPESGIPAPVCGDANGDGKVTSTDALRALRAAVGGAPCAGPVCDVDASGKITATDALKILKLAVGQPVKLDCGASG